MTVILDDSPAKGPLYSIRETEDRGKAVFVSQRIPSGTTVLVASEPFVSVIKEEFKKEVCAWCFKYQHGKSCSVRHPEICTGVWFCSADCLNHWTQWDSDGKLTEALATLRTRKARKVCPSHESISYWPVLVPLRCAWVPIRSSKDSNISHCSKNSIQRWGCPCGYMERCSHFTIRCVWRWDRPSVRNQTDHSISKAEPSFRTSLTYKIHCISLSITTSHQLIRHMGVANHSRVRKSRIGDVPICIIFQSFLRPKRCEDTPRSDYVVCYFKRDTGRRGVMY